MLESENIRFHIYLTIFLSINIPVCITIRIFISIYTLPEPKKHAHAKNSKKDQFSRQIFKKRPIDRDSHMKHEICDRILHIQHTITIQHTLQRTLQHTLQHTLHEIKRNLWIETYLCNIVFVEENYLLVDFVYVQYVHVMYKLIVWVHLAWLRVHIAL